MRTGRGHQNQLRTSAPVTLLTQRPHNSGWSALLPTSARWCQQRTRSLGGRLGADEHLVGGRRAHLHVATDEQETQFIGQRLPARGLFFAGGDGDLRFQRRTDRTVGAHRLEHLGHLLAHGQQLVEVGGIELGIGRQRRQAVATRW